LTTHNQIFAASQSVPLDCTSENGFEKSLDNILSLGRVRNSVPQYGTMKKKPAYYQINSIVKTFGLIEVLVSQNEFELSELCRRLGWPKTTVHRILLTLLSLGYVKQNPRNFSYMASIKFFEIGREVVRKLNFIETAHPHMVILSQKTGETINLGVLDGVDVVCVDKVESQHQLKQDQPIGARNKAYCTSFGKAILAFLAEDERHRVLRKEPITPSTPRSLRTVKAIEKDLKSVRERGYAVDREEGAKGVRCVGAPILDHDGKVVAGISIAGPALRIRGKDIQRLAKMVKQTASSISMALGASYEQSNNPARRGLKFMRIQVSKQRHEERARDRKH
jgi:DNA-binding IclR family transcriptional regulator